MVVETKAWEGGFSCSNQTFCYLHFKWLFGRLYFVCRKTYNTLPFSHLQSFFIRALDFLCDYGVYVNAWLDARDDPGLPEFRDGNDPLLRPLVQSNASENAKYIEDIILNQLVYLYTTGFDLESAKDARDRIQSEGWRDRASSHVERLRELDPDDLAERRRWFLERLEEAEAR